VLTFDPSPAVFFGFSDGKELTTKEEKRTILETMGVDVLVEFPMTKETASMEPEQFVRQIWVGAMNTKWIVAGKDVSFGKKGAGDEKLLRQLAEELGYQVTTIDKLQVEEKEASSSYIRTLVEAGQMEAVEKFLGTPYKIIGHVEHGKKLGRKLGMPTVNLLPSEKKLLPPNGVYFSLVKVRGKVYKAISNIGSKPTVSDVPVVGIESYLYEFDEQIYGENIEVCLLSYKRPEMRFENVEALKQQMEQDVSEGKIFHQII
jgi:riboflavin kinase/FMN adenylyltransferase